MAGSLKTTGIIVVGGQPITFPSAASDPVSAVNGDVYYNTGSNEFRAYQNGSWTTLGSSTGNYNVDKFTLSGTDITNKYVTLSGSPTTPSDTILNIVGGVVQNYSTDFTITGSQLGWNGLALDGMLTAGDILLVQFN